MVDSDPSKRAVPEQEPLVLVADDDRTSNARICEVLQGRGMRTLSAPDGKAAVEMLRGREVDLVILDVVMPRMDGFEACKIIKALCADRFLPVVLLTSKTDVNSRIEGLRTGADDYVGKPFDERELVARAENMLRIKHLHDEVHEAKQRLERLAVEDELTGAYNYRYLQSRLTEEFKRAQRYRNALGCIMVDVDNFKSFNDSHGHDTGDAVLRHVTATIREAVRDFDVLTRYGGDEFFLILPNTQIQGAMTVAERLWSMIAETSMTHNGRSHDVTVSVGVAVYPGKHVNGKDELLKAADSALYEAKRAGRNQVCLFRGDIQVA